MNPTAIYSKSGKGVQEASGKTSLLNRGDRAVLAAIDGRATLQDVAQKCGKTFDNAFKELVAKLDKDGFIREASPGAAPAAAKPAAGAAKPAAKPAGKQEDSGGFGDLDFSALGAPKAGSAPSRPAPPPQRPAPPPPPRPAAPPPAAPKANPAAEAQAKAQQSALQKAREEAEAKADAERQRIKLEAEAKMRTELEAKARDEASQKLKLEAERKAKEEADAKIKAAQEAAARVAAEAKAKAEAEAKAKVEAERKAREEAERARKAAEEEARKAREEAERARKAAEEEARKAREEAERVRKAAEEEARKAREEAERARKAAEEERKREESERAARRKREEEEEAERRKAREEEDRRHEEERAAKRKQREEEDELEASASRAAKKKKQEDAPAPAKSEAASGLDSLMSDLDSFTTHEETERKEREEADRKAQEAAAQRAREDEERRQREEAARKEKEEARARKEEEKRRKREDEEELAKKREAEEKRLKDEEEKRKKEADERERKAKADEVLAAKANRGPAVAVGEDTDEVRKRMLGRRGGAASAPTFEPVRRKGGGLGKVIVIALVLLLVVGVGAVHVMPVSTGEYERAASEAVGRPVKIGEASMSLLGGSLQIKLRNIQLGDDVKIASGVASPDLGSLRSERKTFSRIELEGVTLPQEAIGQVLLAKVKADNFSVERVVVKKLDLPGAAVLPKGLEADLVYGGDGNLTQATVRGPDTLLAHIMPKSNAIDFEVTASGFPLPVLPELTLSTFRMKGTASQRGMQIAEWGGKVYGGSVSGTANLRWGGGWSIDGVITARELNAAVFAPALLSQGKGEGTGRFSMSGADPAKLGSGGRLDGNFTISSGVLGSFDLGRAIRTSGKEFAGQTQFNELTGQATYERGAVSLRNVSIGAGALNAGASVDIAQSGALSGRIVADMKSSTGRAVNATLHLGGTIKEPQVRN